MFQLFFRASLYRTTSLHEEPHRNWYGTGTTGTVGTDNLAQLTSAWRSPTGDQGSTGPGPGTISGTDWTPAAHVLRYPTSGDLQQNAHDLERQRDSASAFFGALNRRGTQFESRIRPTGPAIWPADQPDLEPDKSAAAPRGL